MRCVSFHCRFRDIGLCLIAATLWLGSDVRAQVPDPLDSDAQIGQLPAPEREEAPTPAIAPEGIAATPRSVDSWPKDINEISVDIRQTEFEVPDRWEAFFERFTEQPLRKPQFRPLQFSWQATEFWHHPLYFDDVPLERYGQMRHPLVQPVLSGVHFFGTLPLLPYKMGVDRPCDSIATLGYYRPGSPAPTVGRRLPLEADAATIEAATWVGLILLLP